MSGLDAPSSARTPRARRSREFAPAKDPLRRCGMRSRARRSEARSRTGAPRRAPKGILPARLPPSHGGKISHRWKLSI
nr:hypothetical protein DWF04_03275 [Cereibacter sphaeroides f. sp. denitrificans]